MADTLITAPFDLSTNRELEEPEANFGDDSPGAGFDAQIHADPVALPYRKLCVATGRPAAASQGLYGGQFDLWLVPHRVSVVRRYGLSELTSLGVTASYQNGKRTCSVVSLIPEAQYVDIGHMLFRVAADVYGGLQPTAALTAPVAVPGTSLFVGVEGRTSASVTLQMSVATPVIQATGKGDRRAAWVFERASEPLYGRDIETWSLLLLPLSQRTLEYELTLSLTRRLAFVPTRWESRPVSITCTLPEP